MAAFGVGSGSADFACDVCLSDHQVSVAMFLRMGLAIRSDLALSLDASGWRKRYESGGGSATAQLVFTTLDVQWYPAGGSQFFMTVGGGIAAFRDAIRTGGPAATSVTTVSPAGTIGLGWDLTVGDQWGVTPYVNFADAEAANVRINAAGSTRRLGATLVQIGVALNWRQHAGQRITPAEWLHPRAGGD